MFCSHIGTEHLLLGLLQDQDMVKVLEGTGLTEAKAREQVLKTTKQDNLEMIEPVPTDQLNRALELSLREALARNSNIIKPAHIALALLDLEDSAAMQIIKALSSQEAVQAAISRAL